MSILACMSYYFLSIIGFFIRYYFLGYIATDYANDKALNRKRHWALLILILYIYFIDFLVRPKRYKKRKNGTNIIVILQNNKKLY
jgi:hypothetical protein